MSLRKQKRLEAEEKNNKSEQDGQVGER